MLCFESQHFEAESKNIFKYMQNNTLHHCIFVFSAELNFFGFHCLNSTAVQLAKKLAVKRGPQVFVVLSLLVKLVQPQVVHLAQVAQVVQVQVQVRPQLHKLVTGERQEGVGVGDKSFFSISIIFR